MYLPVLPSIFYQTLFDVTAPHFTTTSTITRIQRAPRGAIGIQASFRTSAAPSTMFELLAMTLMVGFAAIILFALVLGISDATVHQKRWVLTV